MSLIEVEVQPEYRSLVGNIVKDFYNPLLSRAVMYKRSVGFFSSSALSEISKGIFGLVRNGGHIQLVASPYLSESDIHSIKMGYEDRDRIIKEAILKELKEPETVFEGQRLNILANLISSGVMDIKIALIEDKNNLGMYHEKMGIIVDSDGNRVAFSGSMNESSTALLVNYETIDAFCSWNGANEEKRVIIKEQAFESIWNNVDPNVTIIDFPELTDEIINRYKKSDVDFEKEDNDRGYDFPDFNIEVELDTNHYPRVPDGFSFHDYQLEAIDNWEKNDYVGIFDMATGTGKTYTGLGSVVRLSEKLNHKLAVIIVCPFQHLVEQWAEDIRKFNMEPIIGYSSSSQKDWKKSLENAVFDQKLNLEGKEFFCLVCTNATFSSSFVQTQLNRINGDCLLLVDEAHNFGSLNLRKLLDEKYNYRLALSATLERIYDEDGTKKLMEYFGNKCIEYDLRRAIEEKKLTRYKYYPVLVELTSDELKKYNALTRQIVRSGLSVDKFGNRKLNDTGKMLALKRARGVAAAENKIYELEKVIQPYLNDNHILVYCGSATMPNIDSGNMNIEDEDIRQIDMITVLLGNKLNMKVSQYTSRESMPERKVIKDAFAEGEELQALVAIKCLDEGVNIPSIKTAFILASTSNPKEYIQRRGRVLRLYEGKDFAEIYDFITLPQKLNDTFSATKEEIEPSLGLVRKELKRAFEFADIADNYIEVNDILNEIKELYGIDEEIDQFKEEFDYYE